MKKKTQSSKRIVFDYSQPIEHKYVNNPCKYGPPVDSTAWKGVFTIKKFA